ncbi:MAG: hypothetical protein ACE5GY_09590 [Thermodesulfobacteriota bacterium]
MNEQVKICPACSAEYYAHITECRSCEMALVTPEEFSRARAPQQGEGALVCIEEGDYERITGLVHALGSLGIEAQVLKAPGGGCGGGFGIFVHQSIARTAVQKVEELWHKLYPEIKEAEARMESGLCPACGSKFHPSDVECPDCGLFLGGDGGGGHGGCSPGGHSGCGPGCP